MGTADPRGALRLEGLTASYPGFRLGPIDLTLGPGETLAVLGPNGSGKSTLLRVVAGLEPATSGRILLGGRDLTQLPTSQRGIGMVFQDLALFPQRTVRANLEYGPRVQGWPRPEVEERTEELLDQFRLRPLHDRRPEQLSGGERQRVALARALAPRPSVLLLDEPLAAADPRSGRGLQAEIKGYLRTAGVPALYVTHDFEEGFFLCSRVALLQEGSWVEEGTSDRVFGAPRNPFTAWFLGYNLLPPGDLAALPRDLRLVPEGTPGSLPAIVVDSGSSGSIVRVVLRLEAPGRGPGMEPIEAHLPAGSPGPAPAPGERVGVVVDRSVRLDEGAPPEGFKRGEGSRPPTGKQA